MSLGSASRSAVAVLRRLPRLALRSHHSDGARIGARCSFAHGVYLGNDVCIGDNVNAQSDVSVSDAVTIEDDVSYGPSMVFTNVYNPRSAVIRKDEYRRTLVKRESPELPTQRSQTGVSVRSDATSRWPTTPADTVAPGSKEVGLPRAQESDRIATRRAGCAD